MTPSYTDSGRPDRSPYFTRFDAMYASLPTSQRLVLWVLTGIVALQVPPMLSSTLAEKTALIVVFTLVSFMMFTTLFSWFNER